MIASSAFVLTALTMTGVYMQSRDRESEDNGYTIDFTALENNVDDMYQEIAENRQPQDDTIGNLADIVNGEMEDDLDYWPLEAGSDNIEIPGLTDRETLDAADIPDADVTQALSVNEAETSVDPNAMDPVTPPSAAPEQATPEEQAKPKEQAIPKEQASASDSAVVNQELHFSESEGLVRPLNGETVIPFSTKSSAYYATLAQYKWSKAMSISAPEGTTVKACADGKVLNIFEDAEIGHAVTVELGDGYEIIYGQLRDIQVAVGSYVKAGDTIGSVEKPTKYYVREGSNLYLQLKENGKPVNPEPLFK